MEIGTLIDLIRYGFAVVVIIYCIRLLWKGLKDISKIDNIKN
jgi:hypothetical protein